MTSKMHLVIAVVLAALCATSAVRSSAVDEALSLRPTDVIECLLKVLRAVAEVTKRVAGTVDQFVQRMQRRQDAEGLGARWNSQLDGLVLRAKASGAAGAEACLERQREDKMAAVLDKLPAELKQCVDGPLEKTLAAVNRLESMSEAVLESALEGAGECAQGGSITSIICLGKVLVAGQTEALALAAESLTLSGVAAWNIAKASPKTTACLQEASTRLQAEAAAVILEAGTTCLPTIL